MNRNACMLNNWWWRDSQAVDRESLAPYLLRDERAPGLTGGPFCVDWRTSRGTTRIARYKRAKAQ